MANRLARESSPYLLQHRNNPVDWYPWGEEARARALAENRPILLSIGYSACHWCHVMERESFENSEIAALMNENFVCIKVDREERPDLDQIYQPVAQVLNQSGGWPLTVFLTPDLRPFFGGTYFSPADQPGRPGFPRILGSLAQAFREDRTSVDENARRLTEFIAQLSDGTVSESEGPGRSAPENETRTLLEKLEGINQELLRAVDWQEGGIGGAPKFPNPTMLDFLWRFGAARGAETSMAATLLTLTKMASGGIYDQLGGGFHRYSVDATWSVPHFEKMLYDNALLLKLYSQVLLSGHELLTEGHRQLFTQVIAETVDYLLREMRSGDGAFYASQDADSEGEEGRYFVWKRAELDRFLSVREAEVFARRFGVSEQGGFEGGKNVLHLAQSIAEIATSLGASEAQVKEWAESARARLLVARRDRLAPATDIKVLAGWNGLAISGLAWAAQALDARGRPEEGRRAWLAASGAFAFICARMARRDHRLYSIFQADQPRLNACLDDYAFLSMAALDLARFGRQPETVDAALAQAESWVEVILRHFSAGKDGGYYFTSDDHEKLIQRPRTLFDQATPSGTGVMIHCLLALGELDRVGRGAVFAEEAERQLRAIFPRISEQPFGYGELINAVLLQVSGPVVVSGPEAPGLCRHPHVFQRPMPAREPVAGLLVCHRRTCGLPLASLQSAAAEVGRKIAI